MSEFKTYDSWLEAPYQREHVEQEPDDDYLYLVNLDKEMEEEKWHHLK